MLHVERCTQTQGCVVLNLSEDTLRARREIRFGKCMFQASHISKTTVVLCLSAQQSLQCLAFQLSLSVDNWSLESTPELNPITPVPKSTIAHFPQCLTVCGELLIVFLPRVMCHVGSLCTQILSVFSSNHHKSPFHVVGVSQCLAGYRCLVFAGILLSHPNIKMANGLVSRVWKSLM